MSSSSVTACSRSPSPATPESSDSLDTKMFHRSLQTWCETFSSGDFDLDQEMWAKKPQELSKLLKNDNQESLEFHDLIQEQIFDDMTIADPTLTSVSPMSFANSPQHQIHVVQMADVLAPNRSSSEQPKPVSPLLSVQRPPNIVHNVVHPRKETCSNLSIIIPSIPEAGTKSRVETQIRLILDLAHASTSSGSSPTYDRVGSWKCLRLPQGTSTKKRTRKEGNIDAMPQDTLYLSAEVTCSSSPQTRVGICSSCKVREAKRAARKVAARVRPAPSDSELPDRASSENADQGFNLIQFNCPRDLDFSKGTIILPMRITCYCRHHREKVGFNVHFKMMDHLGRVVGSGITPPIMITDDHKSTNKSQSLPHSLNASTSPDPSPLSSALERHHKFSSKDNVGKKRPKPYDGPNAAGRKLRKVDGTDPVTPSMSHSVVTSSSPTRSSSPAVSTVAHFVNSNLLSPSASFLSVASPTDFVNGMYSRSDVPMPDYDLIMEALDFNDPSRSPAVVSIPTPPESVHSPGLAHVVPQQPPTLYFPYDLPPQPTPLLSPKIHRLIPSSGPTHGGIEVTILGENFRANVQYNCLFGDVMASSTQRWSDNTLVCVLPARSSAGVVAVWFDGVEKRDDGTPPCLFTYTDESDRVLMELALQVVGMKLNGKLEDARSVAMRIIGSSSSEDNSPQDSTSSRQFASTATIASLRPLLLTRTDNGRQFERLLIDFLSILDADVGAFSTSSVISQETACGQTLLHLASFQKFSELVSFLVERGIDIDLRDRNGYTALHFAAYSKSIDCTLVLVRAGASEDIVNVLGKTPSEIAPAGFFDDAWAIADEDDEAAWGDAEDTEGEEHDTPARRPRMHHGHLRHLAERSHGMEQDVKEVEGDPTLTVKEPPPASEAMEKKGHLDSSGLPTDKVTATIVEMIYRTIAQLQHPQDMIPNVAQLPLLQLPDLRQLSARGAVPWSSLPQMPAVFPVFIPIPAWSSLWSDKRGDSGDEAAVDGQGSNQRKVGSGPQLRAIWEKIVQNAAIATGNARDDPPPSYQSSQSNAVVQRAGGRQSVRRINYEDAPVPERELNAYGPAVKASTKMQKKHDRMLILFWIPILFIGFFWFFLQSIWTCFAVLKSMIPSRSWMRV